jgi:hypothetical protein
VETTSEEANVEPATADEAATSNEGTTLTEPNATEDVAMVESGTAEELTIKKPRKVKADAPSKKQIVAATLKVLQDRKVSMTCTS